MARKKYLLYISVGVIILIILLLIFWKKKPTGDNHGQKGDKVHLSWNILFSPGTDKPTRDKTIQNIKNFIKDYKDADGKLLDLPTLPVEAFCPCDTLLYTLNFDPIIGGVGKSLTSPPPSSVPTANGDYAGVSKLSENISIDESFQFNPPDSFLKDPKQREARPTGIARIYSEKIDPNQILAIIDSGIDTALFSGEKRKLIWAESGGAPTIFNFLPNQPIGDFVDNTSHKHGSAVAALALAAMGNTSTTIYPRIMILKALDGNNAGSIFSVSCALSYAVQKNATIINASLGYYGEVDSILQHYVNMTTTHVPAIELFASAGNTRGSHDPALLCKTPTDSVLKSPRLFYPACFRSATSDNITSVTQLNDLSTACFYQNFSDQFVSLGVHNRDPFKCCFMSVQFTNGIEYYEGTSFAAPIASGLRMRSILTGVPMGISQNSTSRATIMGSYVEYP